MRDKALVIFSGGQDSTTCLYWAKKHFEDVIALTFSYRQKHIKEIEQARIIAQDAGVEFHLIDASFISTLGSNSLTDLTIEMDTEKRETEIPNTFVPGRNLFFISIAAVFARERGIKDIITGTSQTDFSGYPDCRDNFIKSLNVTINLAMDSQICIHTPLMWLDKSEIWMLADKLGIFPIIQTQTLTCYNGIVGDGCGECPACSLRNKGLKKYLLLKSKNNE